MKKTIQKRDSPITPEILLIGDSCLDLYYYGVCERLSPEAPVPVLKISNVEKKDGMAANVKNNLEALGCNVNFITGNNISVKKRYIDERSKQHIVRVDEDAASLPVEINKIENIDSYDAIVISDYDKGLITYNVVRKLRNQFSGPIFVDTKKRDLSQFEGCFVKINNSEYALATGKCSDLIVTLGRDGARYKDQIFPAPVVDATDVCGAGDTFLSALAYGFLTNKDMAQAIEFANVASAITVTKIGVYAPSMDEVLEKGAKM